MPEAEIARWADSKIRFSPNILDVFSAAGNVVLDWPATLGQITCLVLLISGAP